MQRRLTAILSADAVGYSRLMAEDEEATARSIAACRHLISDLVGQRGGRVVDAPGDNLLAEFPSVVDAVRCAVQIQEELERRNAELPAQRRLLFRIGVNLGDVLIEGDRIVGDGVNVAARLESLAEPGGVCISGTAFDQVEGKLAFGFEDAGEQTVKNRPKPVRIYRALLHGGRRGRRFQHLPWRRVLVAGLLLLAAGIAVVLARRLDMGAPSARPDSTPIRSLAVLPLDNLSGDPEQEYFTFGLTEALISELAKLEELRVISRTSVTPYEETTLPLRKIAADLGVEAIVEGSVLRAGNRVRITAQLIDARSDHHLWAESYERDLGDILALQTEVAREIAKQIEVEVVPPGQATDGQSRRVDPEAYEAYLKGYYFQMKRTREDTLKAVEYFQRAIRLDPGSPLGYSGLADEYSCAPTHSWSIPESDLWPSVPREMIARARENALKAVELDPNSGPAHNSIALIRMFGDWDWPGAEAEFRKALALTPNRAWAHSTYALFLAFMGRFEESLIHMEKARALDPLRVDTTMDRALVHAWSGDRDQAYVWWKKAQEIDPNYPGLHQSVVSGFCGSEVHAEAMEALEGANREYPDDPLILTELAYCHAVSGGQDHARKILRDVEAQAGSTYVSPVGRALVHVGLDERDQAFEALEQGFRDRDFLLLYLGLDSPWEPLRDDPRFADLMDRIGLPRA